MNLDISARDVEIVVVDFEGTGVVEGYPDEPWQVGMVRVRGGRVVVGEQFESLLRVGDRPFSPYAPGRHGQLRGQLAGAPALPELWPRLRAWWAGGPVAAHNAATERKYLQQAFPLHRCGPWIDTLKLARIAYPRLPSHALEDLATALRLTGQVQAACPGREPHDAVYDAVACAVLLVHLLGQDGWAHATVRALAAARPDAFYRRRPPRPPA